MLDLKNCPFCGGTDIATDGPSYTQFMCNGCGAATYDQRSHVDAIAAWNRRASPTADQRVEVNALEWEEGFEGGSLTGTAQIGNTYRFYKSWLSGNWICSTYELGADFSTVAEAKSAAQADYEQRIRSALRTGEQP